MWPGALIILLGFQHIYYGCTVNLEVTFSSDAPMSRAGAWNCLQPQEMGRPFQGVPFSKVLPPQLKFQRAIVGSICFAKGKGKNWIAKGLNFIKLSRYLPACLLSLFLISLSSRCRVSCFFGAKLVKKKKKKEIISFFVNNCLICSPQHSSELLCSQNAGTASLFVR